jgi:hypothetical protein
MMTEQSSSQSRPDDWGRGGYVPGEQYADEQYYGASGPARPGSAGSGPGLPGQGGPGYGGSDRVSPGYVVSDRGGSGYGGSGQGGAGYGGSVPGAPGGPGGVGAVRPNPGMPGQGAPGPGMPTTPIWQATPGQGGAGQGAPGQAGLGQAGPGQAGPGHGGPPPGGAQSMGRPMMAAQADAKGFLSALFDFSFTSFVTTRIIKALYVLILVLAVLTALFYTVIAFRVSATFGLLTLVIGDPLFIVIVMAFWRLILEAAVVVFRISEDLRAIRERGDR